MKWHSVIFCFFVVLLMFLPMLELIGVHETWETLYGVEKDVPVPELTWKSWSSGVFQKGFTDHFAKTFFPRKTVLKTRNQMFEWANFGLFHEGYARKIIQGKNGYLYETGYVKFHARSHWSLDAHGRDGIGSISELAALCARNGIRFIFVMAPDKVMLYQKYLPSWCSTFFELYEEDVSAEILRSCHDGMIPFFDASAFLRGRKKSFQEEFFPISGIHWNALAVAQVLNGVVSYFNDHFPEDRLAAGRFCGVKSVVGHNATKYDDDDLANMLNIFDDRAYARNVRYQPIYDCAGLSKKGRTAIVFGDSFSRQMAQSCIDSGFVTQSSLCHCDKRIPSTAELQALGHKLDLLLLVYMPRNIYNMNAWQRHLEALKNGIARQFCRKDDGSTITNTAGMTMRVNGALTNDVYVTGFSGFSNGYRWSEGRRSLLRVPLTNACVCGRLRLDVLPYVAGSCRSQRMVVKINGNVVREIVGCLPHRQIVDIELKSQLLANRILDVELLFPDAVSPATVEGSRDQRLLAWRFYRVSVEEIKQENMK